MKAPITQIAAGAALLFITLTAPSRSAAQTPPPDSQGPQMQDEMSGCPGIMGGGMMGGMMRGGGSMGGMMMQGRGMGMGNCPMLGGDASAHVAGRVAFLKAELAITDQQKEAWDAYAAALKKDLQAMQTTHAAMVTMMQAKTAAERLDARIAAMETRLAALKELRPPLANLYTVLSDDQKKKADELLSGMGSMM